MYRGRTARAVAIFAIILIIIVASTCTWPSQARLQLSPLLAETSQSRCPVSDAVPVVIVKTGATEAATKLPLIFPSLRCAPEVVFVSDLNQKIQGRTLHDVLANFSREAMRDNPDFELYRQQVILARTGQFGDIETLGRQTMYKPDWRTGERGVGWALDKYKFLHQVEFAWHIYPARSWYMFIEADTFLHWSNLLRWLRQWNSTEQYYFGSPKEMREHPTPLEFALGGAGIILSGATVRRFVEDKAGLARRWDFRIHNMWFGDYVLAAALDDELDLRITNVYPAMQQQEPALLPWGDFDWCHPILTLHHMSEGLQEQLRALNPLNRKKDVVTWRDLFYFLEFDKLSPLANPIRDWDNWSGDLPYSVEPLNYTSACLSVDSCMRACSEIENCLQFSFSTETNPPRNHCMLSWVFRNGVQSHPDKTDLRARTWTSGWMTPRVEAWVLRQNNCSNREDWFSDQPFHFQYN